MTLTYRPYPCDWCDAVTPATHQLMSPSVTRWVDYACTAHTEQYRDGYEAVEPFLGVRS